MIPYRSFRYIYPPRPELAVPATRLAELEEEYIYMAQPKLNGDSMLVFTNGIELHTYNRHKQQTKKIIGDRDRFLELHRETVGDGSDKNKWIVLVAEYMDKGKRNEWDENRNGDLVLFDIIAFDSVQLVGKTFKERVDLMDKLYGTEDKEILDDGIRHHKFLYTTPVKGVYRVKTFRECFTGLWNDLVEIDMFEGLVLKRADAPLENGVSQKNNTSTQVKIRKQTKNYLY